MSLISRYHHHTPSTTQLTANAVPATPAPPQVDTVDVISALEAAVPAGRQLLDSRTPAWRSATVASLRLTPTQESSLLHVRRVYLQACSRIQEERAALGKRLLTCLLQLEAPRGATVALGTRYGRGSAADVAAAAAMSAVEPAL